MRNYHSILMFLLIFLASTFVSGNLQAQQKLSENFWIKCSNDPKFGPKIEYLINIDTENNTWQQKTPSLSTFYICENSEDLIRYKKSIADDCSGFGGGFFSKWTGLLNDNHDYICQVLAEAPTPLYN